MSSATPDVVYIVRIAGYSTGSLAQPVAFVSATATAAPLSYLDGYDVRRIAAPVRPHGAKLDVLAGAASGGATGVSLVYDDTDPTIYRLGEVELDAVKGELGDVCRVAEYVRYDDATIELSSAPVDLDAGDLIYIGPEALLVTSASSSSTTVGVTRARLQTDAVDHPATDGLGPVLFRGLPDIVGKRCTVHRVAATATSASEEELVYRGIIDGHSGPASGRVELAVAPVLRLLQGTYGGYARTWRPPVWTIGAQAQPLQLGLNTDGTWTQQNLTGSIFTDTDWPEDAAATWFYWRVWCDDAWAVLPFNTVAAEDMRTGRPVRVYQTDDDGRSPRPYQVGQGNKVFPRSRWGEVFEPGELQDVTRVEWAYVVAGDERRLSTIVEGLLGADDTLPWSCSLRLQPGDYDATSLEVLDSSIDAQRVASPAAAAYDESALFVLPPVERSKPLLEVLSRELFGPLFIALGIGNDGTLRLIDHRAVFVAGDTVTGSSLRTPGGKPPGVRPRRHRANILREVTYRVSLGGGDDERVSTSDVASNIYSAGREESFDIVWLAAHLDAVEQRAQALLATYEVAMHEVELPLAAAIAAAAGDVLSVDLGFLPGRSGQRATEPQRMLVLQRNEEGARVQKTRGVLLGTDRGAFWAPASEVTGYSAGRATLDISAYDAGLDYTLIWYVGDYVLVVTEHGVLRSATTAEVTAVGDTAGTPYVDASLPVTPNAGDHLISADWGDTPAHSWGWYADTDGTLDGGEAFVWG